MIHVAYRLWGGEGYYAKLTGTSMLSLFENTNSQVTAHILHNHRLTPENRDKLTYIADKYNQHVEFNNVEVLAGESLRKLEEAFPRDDVKSNNAALYPLIVHEAVPNEDRIIFLGADTIFNLDIQELWDYNVDDYTLAAVPENANGEPFALNKNLVIDGIVPKECYFNSDVLYLNLERFRKPETQKLIEQGFEFARQNPQYALYNEQDIMSYCFAKDSLILPGKFNWFVNGERHLWHSTELKKVIYHYAGVKPDFDISDMYNRLFFEHFLKTPWINVEMFGGIYDGINKEFNSQKMLSINIMKMLATRKRTFFTSKNNAEVIKNVFGSYNGDTIIDSLQPNAFGILVDHIKKFYGKRVVFILTGDYEVLRIPLMQQRFIENVDETFDVDRRAFGLLQISIQIGFILV